MIKLEDPVTREARASSEFLSYVEHYHQELLETTTYLDRCAKKRMPQIRADLWQANVRQFEQLLMLEITPAPNEWWLGLVKRRARR